MPGTSPHTFFSIIRGVQKVPQDTLSAEVGLDSIDLLDANGFTVDSYDQQFPNLKGNAVWAENPISDGRTLMTNARGNLTETIRLQLTAPTLIQMGALLSKLGRFRAYVNAFWVGGLQQTDEPIYLKHQIAGEPGPRFALLYDIEIHVETPINPGTSNRELTLSIEREPYWRGLAPGDNPKRWTIEHVMVGQKWDTSKANLLTGNDHLAFQLVDNCQEFLTNTSFQSRNFVDIAAANIPGDVPPLLCVVVTDNSGNGCKHYIAASSNRTTITDRNGIDLPLYNSIPMSSGTIASGTAVFTTDTARGIAHVPTSALKRTVVVTPAGATEVIVVTWNVTNFPHYSMLALKGKYALFLRASQIGGTAGTITSRITMGTAGGTVLDTGLQPVGDDAATGSELNYMGTFEFPPTNDEIVSIDGKGYSAENDITAITISTMRASGVGTIRLIDMMFLPLGNYVYINRSTAAITTNVYDDTGYFTHGKPDPVMMGRSFSSATDSLVLSEGSGRLQLVPGVTNRLYFLEYRNSTGAAASEDMTVRANIIPRWTGYRDV